MVEGWMSKWEIADMEKIPSNLPRQEREELVDELVEGAQAEVRPHTNKKWADRGIVEIYWSKGMHLLSKKERGKTVGWQKSHGIRDDEMSDQRKFINAEMDAEFRKSFPGGRARGGGSGEGNIGGSNKKRKQSATAQKEEKDQERQQKLSKMPADERDQFIVNEEHKKAIHSAKSACNKFMKHEMEFDRLRNKFIALSKIHKWLPICKMTNCEKELISMKSLVKEVNKTVANLESMKGAELKNAGDPKFIEPTTALDNALTKYKSVLDVMTKVMGSVYYSIAAILSFILM